MSSLQALFVTAIYFGDRSDRLSGGNHVRRRLRCEGEPLQRVPRGMAFLDQGLPLETSPPSYAVASRRALLISSRTFITREPEMRKWRNLRHHP